ncbi:MAG TPA: ribosome small subunit-dependent GTPase A [Thermotogae bacterium]|nr:ribosome small subunit-dependent GTPase A [Thermotogota bacterium]
MARRVGRVVRFHSDQVTVVDINDGTHINLKLRGRFKKQGIRPIVGDLVEYTPDGYGSGLVENILHRKNELKKPSVANVDQVIVVTTLKNPEVPPSTVDRITVLAERAGVDIVIVFNKIDLLSEEETATLEDFIKVYEKIYPVYKTSVKRGWGIDTLRSVFAGKVSALAGLSGVGKSSLLNAVNPGLQLRTGELSKKGRGRHTTTFSQLLELDFGGFVVDTPGFSSLELGDMEVEELKEYFPEFRSAPPCAFSDCIHVAEPGCSVKDLVEKGEIAPSRYQSYLMMIEELEEKEDKKPW